MIAALRTKRLLWIVGPVALLAALGVAVLWRREPPDPEGLRRSAIAEAGAGHWARAAEFLDRLDRLRPPTAEDRSLRAQVEVSRGRPDAALEALRPLADDPRARRLAGEIELSRQRLRRAEAELLRALELDPAEDRARRKLVVIYGLQRRYADMVRQFRVLARTDGLTDDQMHLWGMALTGTDWTPVGASDTLRRAIEADPGDRRSRLALAEFLRREGQIDQAQAVLEPLADSDPDALAIRARIALDRDREEEAARLLAEGPTDRADLARLRGRLALARRDGRAAVRHFEIADRLEPGNRGTLLGLANAWRLLGEPAKAVASREAAQRIEALANLLKRFDTPDGRRDKRLVHDLGAACRALNHPDEARAWYSLALSKDPLDSEAQRALFRLNREPAGDPPASPGGGGGLPVVRSREGR